MLDELKEPIYLYLTNIPRVLRRIASALPQGIQLRAAELPADEALIADLYNQAFDGPQSGKATPQEVLRYANHPSLSGACAYLAFWGKQAIGFGVARLDLPSAGQIRKLGAIELLAVAPTFQHRGVGRALVRTLLDWLSTQGATLVSACTLDAGVAAALLRYGFRRGLPWLANET